MDTITDYPTVIVVKVDGTRTWALAFKEGPVYFQAIVPLPKGEQQTLTIPWSRIDQIETADADEAPWNQ